MYQLKGKSGGEALFKAILAIVIPRNHQYSRAIEDCRLADATAVRTAGSLMFRESLRNMGPAKEVRKRLVEVIRNKLRVREYLKESTSTSNKELVMGVEASLDVDDASVEPGGASFLFTLTGAEGAYKEFVDEKGGTPAEEGETCVVAAQELTEATANYKLECGVEDLLEVKVRARGEHKSVREGSAAYWVLEALKEGARLEFKELMAEVEQYLPGVKPGTVRVAIHTLKKRGAGIRREGKQYLCG